MSTQLNLSPIPKTAIPLGQPSPRDRRKPSNLEPIVPASGPSFDLANSADGNEENGDDQLVDFSYSTPGALPGTLRIPTDALPTEIFLITYNPEAVHTATIDHPEECRAIAPSDSVQWLDARGLGSEATLRQMSQTLGFHPLMLEDIVNVPHRPKIDFYDDKILIIMQMVRPNATGSGVFSEQVIFVLGQNSLATFQEEPEWDSLEPVRDRIRRGTGIIRRQQADYLAYALLDTIVDSFFPVLEVIGETLEELEEEVVETPTSHTIERIHRMRRGLMRLRRYIWPQRSVINSLIRDSDELISQEVRVYLQDVYDHIVQVVDIIENYREIASSLMDVYLSSINNRMNEVMKLLTVISIYLYPPHLYRRGLRHELQPRAIALQHARTGVVLGLRHLPVRYGHDCGPTNLLLLETRLVRQFFSD